MEPAPTQGSSTDVRHILAWRVFPGLINKGNTRTKRAYAMSHTFHLPASPPSPLGARPSPSVALLTLALFFLPPSSFFFWHCASVLPATPPQLSPISSPPYPPSPSPSHPPRFSLTLFGSRDAPWPRTDHLTVVVQISRNLDALTYKFAQQRLSLLQLRSGYCTKIVLNIHMPTWPTCPRG